MTITAQDLVRREVHYCVSSLVHTLAGATAPGPTGNLLTDLVEQAMDLAAPMVDYEEAAREAGWEGPHKDKFGATYFEDETDGATYACADWQALCEEHGISALEQGCYREVLEHWIVSDWLADKLIEKGEKVDKDFGGMTVWARTTTGQAIYMDSVIEDITRELNEGSAEA